MAKQVWGYWDCPYCDRKGIRGDIENCPSCASSRDKDIKFYMRSENAPVYVTEAERQNLSDEANWICASCGSQNDNKLENCTHCGAPKADSEGNYFTVRQQRQAAPPPTPAPAPAPRRKRKKKINFKKGLTVLTVFAVIIGVLYALFAPREYEMKITEMNWECVTEIEELRTVSENGWSLPSGAVLKDKRSEIKKYDKVIDHYETKTRTVTKYRTEYEIEYKDMGNGRFEERQVPKKVPYTDTETYEAPVYKQVPVYDTKYYYDIDRWVKTDSERFSGNSKEIVKNGRALADNERRGKSEEKYTITGTVKKKSKTFTLNYNRWNQLNVGDKVQFEADRDGNIIDIYFSEDE